MTALIAHAGEEILYILAPILLILWLRQLGRRRRRDRDDEPQR